MDSSSSSKTHQAEVRGVVRPHLSWRIEKNKEECPAWVYSKCQARQTHIDSNNSRQMMVTITME